MWCLTFKYSCSLFNFFLNERWLLRGDYNGATWAGHKSFRTIRLAACEWCVSPTKCTALIHRSDLNCLLGEQNTTLVRYRNLSGIFQLYLCQNFNPVSVPSLKQKSLLNVFSLKISLFWNGHLLFKGHITNWSQVTRVLFVTDLPT